MVKPSVLIVDESEDSRQVLRTALERRGMSIFEASQTDEGLKMARDHQPNVIVLDLEVESAQTDEICGRFAQESRGDSPALLVLGKVQRPHNHSEPPTPDRQFVAKPYHYAALVRRIEELLA